VSPRPPAEKPPKKTSPLKPSENAGNIGRKKLPETFQREWAEILPSIRFEAEKPAERGRKKPWTVAKGPC
jgi:hypothetical protein